MRGRKGAKMIFPHLIPDLYKMANVKASGQDPIFRPLGPLNYGRNHLEIAKAWHITLGTISLSYFTESYPTTPADTPSSSRKGKKMMVVLEDDKGMAEGDSREC
ncbi:uncharacterized protein G2W53_041176 [Senna tora]|uniref:Uncharacterized protein n=1 Tax=Senna tora TaxID=362788 RepID=A0A834SGN3_9FABA|nr:uncharacterized protein G2W53_041176 [Senna tora]